RTHTERDHQTRETRNTHGTMTCGRCHGCPSGGQTTQMARLPQMPMQPHQPQPMLMPRPHQPLAMLSKPVLPAIPAVYPALVPSGLGSRPTLPVNRAAVMPMQHPNLGRPSTELPSKPMDVAVPPPLKSVGDDLAASPSQPTSGELAMLAPSL